MEGDGEKERETERQTGTDRRGSDSPHGAAQLSDAGAVSGNSRDSN